MERTQCLNIELKVMLSFNWIKEFYTFTMNNSSSV